MARKTDNSAAVAVAERVRGGSPGVRTAGGDDGRRRAVIYDVRPSVDGGAFEIKRIVGDRVDVEADVVSDGHDKLSCVVEYRRAGEDERAWTEVPLVPTHNDLWLGSFVVSELGGHEYRVRAWVDHFKTWSGDLKKRIDAGQDIGVDLLIGAELIEAAAGADAAGTLSAAAKAGRDEARDQHQRAAAMLDPAVAAAMWDCSPRAFEAVSGTYRVWADRRLARFSAWYELFPRSCSPEPGKHGTLRDVIGRLPYVEEMGFDVLYLPPIHPIGETARKGKNNTEHAGPGDVGSPWAIGGFLDAAKTERGGHTAIHPELGTLDDFDALVAACKGRGIELAMDIAFQCSPDHPWVEAHPEWFKARPDGTIQYAENPPKKYQDIYPINFESEDWRGLWAALKGVFEFWIARGVTVFRVDNPHTKAFGFWDWVIHELRRETPELIFLAEAFTRPKRMYRLAKGGYTQSYTYFSWRNGPGELREYVEELASAPVSDFFRPNFWPNTPDILTDYLRDGGRSGSMARFVLAATLVPSFGIYGPSYELCDVRQRPGSEENLDNEKYEIRAWDLDDRWSLRHFIGAVNRVRREHPALQQMTRIRFHDCDNPAHLAYSKTSPDGDDAILCVVNTNAHEGHGGMVRMDLGAMGIGHDEPFRVVDLLTGREFRWRGPDQFVELGPGMSHLLHVLRESGEPAGVVDAPLASLVDA